MKLPISSVPLATPGQIDYLIILCNDIGCTTQKQSLDLISNFIGRPIKFYGALTKVEVTRTIDELKERRGR